MLDRCKPVGLGLLVLVIVCLLWLVTTSTCDRFVRAERGTPPGTARYLTGPEIADAIGNLKPRMSPKRRNRWAARILFAEANYPVGDPILVVSMVMKESSFMESFWNHQEFGRGGRELGALQVHPRSSWRRFRPEGCAKLRRHEFYDMTSKCSFWTAFRMIRYTQKRCGGTLWRIVASYKYGRCIPEPDARVERASRNAYRNYCKALDNQELCDQRWEVEPAE